MYIICGCMIDGLERYYTKRWRAVHYLYRTNSWWHSTFPVIATVVKLEGSEAGICTLHIFVKPPV